VLDLGGQGGELVELDFEDFEVHEVGDGGVEFLGEGVLGQLEVLERCDLGDEIDRRVRELVSGLLG
jgi:hypothetical protein